MSINHEADPAKVRLGTHLDKGSSHCSKSMACLQATPCACFGDVTQFLHTEDIFMNVLAFGQLSKTSLFIKQNEQPQLLAIATIQGESYIARNKPIDERNTQDIRSETSFIPLWQSTDSPAPVTTVEL